MTTLSVNKPRKYGVRGINEHPVIASDIIYQGAAVGDNGSGYARPLQAGDPFRGFADDIVDNSSGSAGDKTVKVRAAGLVTLGISGVAITDVGKAVYASDDDTFTLTAGSNSCIGYVHRFVESGVAVVYFEAQSGVVTPLTDSTTETADDTVADVSTAVTGVDGSGNNAASKADVDTRLGVINENFSDITAKVNYLIARLG